MRPASCTLLLQTGDWSVKAPLPACSAVYDGVGDLWYSSRQADGSCGAVTVCRGGLEGAACQQVGLGVTQLCCAGWVRLEPLPVPKRSLQGDPSGAYKASAAPCIAAQRFIHVKPPLHPCQPHALRLLLDVACQTCLVPSPRPAPGVQRFGAELCSQRARRHVCRCGHQMGLHREHSGGAGLLQRRLPRTCIAMVPE